MHLRRISRPKNLSEALPGANYFRADLELCATGCFASTSQPLALLGSITRRITSAPCAASCAANIALPAFLSCRHSTSPSQPPTTDVCTNWALHSPRSYAFFHRATWHVLSQRRWACPCRPDLGLDLSYHLLRGSLHLSADKCPDPLSARPILDHKAATCPASAD